MDRSDIFGLVGYDSHPCSGVCDKPASLEVVCIVPLFAPSNVGTGAHGVCEIAASLAVLCSMPPLNLPSWKSSGLRYCRSASEAFDWFSANLGGILCLSLLDTVKRLGLPCKLEVLQNNPLGYRRVELTLGVTATFLFALIGNRTKAKHI